jgi:hypothetical protein
MPGGYRNWCFTLNNPTEEERSFFTNFQLGDFYNYLIFQEEKGEEEGTTHFQGYIECREKRALSWMKIHFNERAHYEPRKGTQQQAIDYCKKEDTRVEGGMSGEFGQPKRQVGGLTTEERRKRASETLEQIRKGEIRTRDVDSDIMLFPGFPSAQKLALASLGKGPDRSETFRVFVVNGPTGVGKSFAFHKICNGDYIGWRSGWFTDAQNMHRYLFLDEFVGGCRDGIQLHELLDMLDPYPQQLPIKGGFAPAMYDTVFITTNISPENWYSSIGSNGEEIKKRKENLMALYDRIGFLPNDPDPNYQRVRTYGHYLDLWEDDPENPLFLGGRIHENVDQKRDRLKRWLESFGFKY